MRPIVAMCCFCEKLRDDTGTEPGRGLWQDFKFYMARHMLRPEEVMFSHTYCPDCLSSYRDFLRPSKGANHGPEMEKRA
jgi:hypothetical protein